ncbi:MAG: DPP IV N-terminal domain-containing protein [Cellulophaga sp.]
MKVKSLFFVAITTLFLLNCNHPEKQEIVTAEDYTNATKHLASNLNRYLYNTIDNGKWQENGLFTYQKKNKNGTEFILLNPETKKRTTAFNPDKLASALSKITATEIDASNLPFNSFSIPTTNTISFSIGKQDYQCNLKDYSIEEISKPTVIPNEYISPNGKIAAYISKHNLWIRNVKSNKRTQLTFDGKQDYGYATNNAGWVKNNGPVLKWSPNSDKIATFQQDARGVGEMYLTSTNVGHPKLEAWKHPLPGDSIIFRIERIVIHLNAKPKVVRLQMNPDFQRSTTTDHIAGRGGEFLDVEWKKDGSEIAFVSSSRDHKIAHLQMANTQTGKVTSIYKEEVETYFESGANKRNWHVLYSSSEIIWFSERDNWGHLYLYDLETKQLKHKITKGNWAVQQLLHIDETKRELFFTAKGKEEGNLYHTYLYKIDFDGKNLVNLTPEKGHHSFKINSSWDYIIDTYSTTTNPPVSVLRNTKGEKIMDLETADISELKTIGWQEPIEFNVKARDKKTPLYGLLYLPSHYDENKSYPIINYLYPGPQSGSIRNFGFAVTTRDHQAIAELGFAVVAVNAMGTPGRSKSFHDFYYGNMGDNGLPDNITTIKQLAEKHKGLDTTRVGIWGHSGGGFASTRAVFSYPDFYDVAVSGAGNHDNRNYEADWGEKWQGLLINKTLEGQQVASTNYDSQANQLFAQNLKGKLLITHGSMDNNVPPSNTMLVVEALIKANKDFDFILFPNKRHGYGDMTNYMTRKRWDYFVKHLKHTEPPKEFSLD